MRNAFQVMLPAVVVAALVSPSATAAPLYSLVSQDRTISVLTETGPTSESDSTVAGDTGAFNESRHVASEWTNLNFEHFSAKADAWHDSAIGPTVLTADLRADAEQRADNGFGRAKSTYIIVFDIPVNTPASLTVDLSIEFIGGWSETRVELLGVERFVLANQTPLPGTGADTFRITREYDLAPGRYTLTVDAESNARDGLGSARSDAYAQLTIIPEPATLGLLALGSLVVLRRRREH